MLTENEVLRQRYEAREKAYRDAIWVERDHRRRLERLQQAEAQVEQAEVRAEQAEVRAEQAEVRAQKGELIGRIHMCQRLLRQPSSPRPELEEMALDSLEALAEQLESKLSG